MLLLPLPSPPPCGAHGRMPKSAVTLRYGHAVVHVARVQDLAAAVQQLPGCWSALPFEAASAPTTSTQSGVLGQLAARHGAALEALSLGAAKPFGTVNHALGYHKDGLEKDVRKLLRRFDSAYAFMRHYDEQLHLIDAAVKRVRSCMLAQPGGRALAADGATDSAGDSAMDGSGSRGADSGAGDGDDEETRSTFSSALSSRSTMRPPMVLVLGQEGPGGKIRKDAYSQTCASLLNTCALDECSFMRCVQQYVLACHGQSDAGRNNAEGAEGCSADKVVPHVGHCGTWHSLPLAASEVSHSACPSVFYADLDDDTQVQFTHCELPDVEEVAGDCANAADLVASWHCLPKWSTEEVSHEVSRLGLGHVDAASHVVFDGRRQGVTAHEVLSTGCIDCICDDSGAGSLQLHHASHHHTASQNHADSYSEKGSAVRCASAGHVSLPANHKVLRMPFNRAIHTRNAAGAFPQKGEFVPEVPDSAIQPCSGSHLYHACLPQAVSKDHADSRSQKGSAVRCASAGHVSLPANHQNPGLPFNRAIHTPYAAGTFVQEGESVFPEVPDRSIQPCCSSHLYHASLPQEVANCHADSRSKKGSAVRLASAGHVSLPANLDEPLPFNRAIHTQSAAGTFMLGGAYKASKRRAWSIIDDANQRLARHRAARLAMEASEVG